LTAIGYVFINTDDGKEDELCAKLLRTGEVTELYRLNRDYKILAKVKGDTPTNINSTVKTKFGGFQEISKLEIITGINLFTRGG
jgi:hypothetical protein